MTTSKVHFYAEGYKVWRRDTTFKNGSSVSGPVALICTIDQAHHKCTAKQVADALNDFARKHGVASDGKAPQDAVVNVRNEPETPTEGTDQSPFKIGDVVRLKSGGRMMTVMDVYPEALDPPVIAVAIAPVHGTRPLNDYGQVTDAFMLREQVPATALQLVTDATTNE